MKSFFSKTIGAALASGVLVLAQAERSYAQDAPPEKSQELLQKVKQGESDLRIAAKQTEIERIKEDMDKHKSTMTGLQKSLDDTNALISESGTNLNQLATQEKSLQQSIDLNELRIEAERKRSEGLKSLSAAQSKQLDAVSERMAELDVQSKVAASEMQLLVDGKPVPGEDNDENGSPDYRKLKKELASSDFKSAAAERLARTAMKSASTRLQSADEAAARAQRMADGLKKGTLPPVAEKTDEDTKDAKIPVAVPVSGAEKNAAQKQ